MPEALPARTFHVRSTPLGNPPVLFHDALVRPVFLKICVPPMKTRTSYLVAPLTLLHVNVGAPVATVPVGAFAVGLPKAADAPAGATAAKRPHTTSSASSAPTSAFRRATGSRTAFPRSAKFLP